MCVLPKITRAFLTASLLCAACAADDPFQTFYSPGWQNTISPMPAYSGPALTPRATDPPVQYVQVINIDQAKSVARFLTAQGYRRIGMSLFESNWPTPHIQEAARMGRKLGAGLVIYAMVGVGTRLQSVPHVSYEPGQSFSANTSGVFGGTYGSATTYGSTSGRLHVERTTEEIGRYTHVAGYLKKVF
jgi:hypothetical protein